MRNVIATCIDKKYGLLYALYDNLNNILACAFFVSCFVYGLFVIVCGHDIFI